MKTTQTIRRYRKVLAVFTTCCIMAQIVMPAVSYALTSGPSQPEVQSFEPAGTTEMVDLFSGDFTYNIPLFELPGPNGGYPFNLAYHSGISMDHEASWVGLGWSLNPGAINRQMRGLPDDFNGDEITTKRFIKDSHTFGAGLGIGFEIFPADVKEISNYTGNSVKISRGVTGFYNNYKGVGYSLEAGISLNQYQGGDQTKSLGLNLSMDPQSGLDLSPSYSLTQHAEKATKSYSLGLGYNSRQGLTSLSLSGSVSKKEHFLKKKQVATKYSGGSFGAGISFSAPTYSPSVSMPMRGMNLDVEIKAGMANTGTYINVYNKGFYHVNKLKDKGEDVSAPAYGYLHYQNATEEDAVMDFNREKQVVLTKFSPNMAIPYTTSDVYSVTAQGLAGAVRPFRSDIGNLKDPTVKSITLGGSAGMDAGIGPNSIKLGINLGITGAFSTSRPIAQGGALGATDTDYEFQGRDAEDVLFEPVYFKAPGETTTSATDVLDYIGGEQPVRMPIADNAIPILKTADLLKQLETHGDDGISISSNRRAERESRNTVAQPFLNKQLKLSANTAEVHPFFQVKDDSTDTKVDRTSRRRGGHIGGFISTSQDGLRYIFGLPAYNRKQVECQFSVDKPLDECQPVIDIHKNGAEPQYKVQGTDQYYNRTETPEFAYAHMLTAVVGPDYIDADDVPGPSEGDMGYWIRFHYKKTSDEYKWRAPFVGANYNRGYESSYEDDKGSYTYGEKEIWYLSRVESKSHVAVFETTKRKDGRGAHTELQNSTDAATHGDYQHKLSRIKLYTRSAYQSSSSNAAPIKEVIFNYDYSQCEGVPNNDGTSPNNAGGKLTLKRVHFKYGKSARGYFSPYQFTYSEVNPSYHTHKYDRWGNYKPYEDRTDASCYSMSFPYVKQGEDAATQAQRKEDITAWALTNIKLPSGADIFMDYEPDDYAYVQNKVAMQMTEVTGIESFGENRLNDKDAREKKIYFKLETPVSASLSSKEQNAVLNSYLDLESNQVYFKTKISLLKGKKEEFINGYMEMADGVKGGLYKESPTATEFTHGYVNVKGIRYNHPITGQKYYHPMSVAAWQHLMINQPKLQELTERIDNAFDLPSKIANVLSTAMMVPDIIKELQGVYPRMYGEGWGRTVHLGHCWIRLNSPDLKKYGGGLRVRQLTLQDNWGVNDVDKGYYGQVYQYTTQEEILGESTEISSGVAAYEPMIGGDEIALRTARMYSEKKMFANDKRAFFELPVNEGYYPGAQVGYSEVTVKSLASAKRAGDAVARANLPDNTTFGTTGASVNKFYTAKDFPVIASNTGMRREKSYPPLIPIFPIGVITYNAMVASQGYAVELNDMHGKPKGVYNYGQDKDGNIQEDLVSSVEYYYKTKEKAVNNKRVTVVDSEVDAHSIGPDGAPTREKRLLGVDHEFFTDIRRAKDETYTVGVELNVDIVTLAPFPVTVGTPWFNGSANTSLAEMAVTNKVIHRVGILDRVVAIDGQSKVTTQNLLWDKQTGEVVLTRVQNNFDDPIYSYNLPAFYHYDKMGAAYQNTGIEFEATLKSMGDDGPDSRRIIQYGIWDDHFVEGDEFIVTDETNGKLYRGVLSHYVNTPQIDFEGDSPPVDGEPTYRFFLYRSGRRNQLTAKVRGFTSLKDPTQAYDDFVDCEIPLDVPILD